MLWPQLLSSILFDWYVSSILFDCRFGNFVELQFNERGRIFEAAIRTYLLERSGVRQVSDPVRSYHCFYLFCAATPEVLLQEEEYVGELHGVLRVGHGSHIVTMPTTLIF